MRPPCEFTTYVSSFPSAESCRISAESAEFPELSVVFGADSSAPSGVTGPHAPGLKIIHTRCKLFLVNTMAQLWGVRQTSAEEIFGARSSYGTPTAYSLSRRHDRVTTTFACPSRAPLRDSATYADLCSDGLSASQLDPRCPAVPSRQNTHTGPRRLTARGFFIRRRAESLKRKAGSGGSVAFAEGGFAAEDVVVVLGEAVGFVADVLQKP